ncbi:hypothetical protein HRS9139_06767 [Pyrenophora teres f. teres]|uniref:Uncharacterized protein n=1 Tax=Pyrenophora teres f. teres TaxID=97479 RepID=A0A6S6W9C9_9PLEO|nr:hypothetical protein HRS9139_06767 [Pyrenophora teres f. teres]CAE7201505.1 hypothetical protein PTTW11_08860 [Pyrenophora teres f. teres]
MVYIRNFTNINKDFAYFIREFKNVERFWAGLHGATFYDGPILASPIILHRQAIKKGRSKVWPIAWQTFIKYEKTGAVNIQRWRYLYETARRAWKLMVFDGDALKVLISFVGSKKDEDQVAPDSFWGERAISASKKDPKANQIAIAYNLRVLIQKEDGDQRILDFLTNELYGRRRLQGFNTITNDQSEFITNLMWAGDSPEERDIWIKCIQNELARPIDDSDDDSYILPDQDYTSTSHGMDNAEDRLKRQQEELLEKTLGTGDAKTDVADSALSQSENNVQGTRKTYRLGISHAGTRIPVDPAGNQVTRLIPPTQLGTLYEQYLKMKRAMQEQYYGHETSSSDPDPHRGVPTKEKFSGSTVKVQEEIDSDEDSHDGDSNREAGNNEREIPSHDEEDFKKVQTTKIELAMNQLLDRPEAESSKYKDENMLELPGYEDFEGDSDDFMSDAPSGFWEDDDEKMDVDEEQTQKEDEDVTGQLLDGIKETLKEIKQKTYNVENLLRSSEGLPDTEPEGGT